MKVTVQISEVNVTEDEVLKRFKEDWNYTRRKRMEKTQMAFYDMPIMVYTIATITSPEEYAGKIAGYSGVGEYQDLFADAGTYVLGGNATTQLGLPNLRGQGISTKLRNKRDSFSEDYSRREKKPFTIIVMAGPNGYTRHLQSKQYVLYDEYMPSWAKKKLGRRYYLTYNSNRSMKKAWDIIKGV